LKTNHLATLSETECLFFQGEARGSQKVLNVPIKVAKSECSCRNLSKIIPRLLLDNLALVSSRVELQRK
jgi:hypothetical protein